MTILVVRSHSYNVKAYQFLHGKKSKQSFHMEKQLLIWTGVHTCTVNHIYNLKLIDEKVFHFSFH